MPENSEEQVMSRQRRQGRNKSEAADSDDVITQVVTRVAERKGVDPSALEPRLFEVVDPEALTTLVEGASADSPISLEFAYAGHQVTVEAAEQVDVTVEVEVSAA